MRNSSYPFIRGQEKDIIHSFIRAGINDTRCNKSSLSDIESILLKFTKYTKRYSDYSSEKHSSRSPISKFETDYANNANCFKKELTYTDFIKFLYKQINVSPIKDENEALRKWKEELDYYESVKSELLADESYRDKYVAVKDKSIVDKDSDEFDLVERVQKKYPENIVLIVRVEEETSIEEIPAQKVIYEE